MASRGPSRPTAQGAARLLTAKLGWKLITTYNVNKIC